MNLVRKIHEDILTHSMLPKIGKLVVAVSGGGDSIALLDIIGKILGKSARGRIVVGHLEHGLRESALKEAEFVRELAHSLRYECHVGHADVLERSRRENRSIEEAARCSRYEFLLSVARECDSKTIITGHHADDQAETLLLNLFRGSGLVGLGGMHPVRPFGEDTDIKLIRPLLCVPRADLIEYINERNLKFCHDESNDDNRLRRNLIRNKIMPNIKAELQPRLSETLNRTAHLAREAAEYINEVSRDIFKGQTRDVAFELPFDIFEHTHKTLRAPAIKAAYKRATGRSLDFDHAEKLLKLFGAELHKSIDLPGAWCAVVSKNAIRVMPKSENISDIFAPWHMRLKIGATEMLPTARTITAELRTYPKGGTLPNQSLKRANFEAGAEEWLDYDAIGAPTELEVRSRREGDTFIPLGAPGKKSVKEFMINSNIPRDDRSRLPIVTTTSGDNKGCIIWVAPIRIAEQAKVTTETKNILVLKLSPQRKA